MSFGVLLQNLDVDETKRINWILVSLEFALKTDDDTAVMSPRQVCQIGGHLGKSGADRAFLSVEAVC